MLPIHRHLSSRGFGLALLLAGATARAEIPADYLGRPYQGSPAKIPGRVELANVDTGGAEISYHADHNRMNSAGYEPISGNDYRPTETDLPNLCKTNTQNPDHWLDGAVYPSETDLYWHYIGYAHAADWVKLTVSVERAGKYTISSNWASAGPKLGLSVWFNDGHSPVDPKHPKDGQNKSGVVVLDGTSDYHRWKSYPNFVTVDLSAGPQVLTFHLEQFDHLQYGFLQFDLIQASAAGSGGVPSSAGMGATAGDSPMAGGGGVGFGGAGAGTGGAPGSSAGASATLVSRGGNSTIAGASNDTSASANGTGCSLSTRHHAPWFAAMTACLALLNLIHRRGVLRRRA